MPVGKLLASEQYTRCTPGRVYYICYLMLHGTPWNNVCRSCPDESHALQRAGVPYKAG